MPNPGLEDKNAVSGRYRKRRTDSRRPTNLGGKCQKRRARTPRDATISRGYRDARAIVGLSGRGLLCGRRVVASSAEPGSSWLADDDHAAARAASTSRPRAMFVVMDRT